MSCRLNPSSFLGTLARPTAAINVVLTQPGMECDLANGEISSSLLDLPALSDGRDRTLTKFWWVRSEPRGELFMKAVD